MGEKTLADLPLAIETHRTLMADKDARIAELTEALVWALAELDGRTKYDSPIQQAECFIKARALAAVGEKKP